MLMTLGSGSIVFIDASDMTCRKMSVGKGVLRTAAFASSLIVFIDASDMTCKKRLSVKVCYGLLSLLVHRLQYSCFCIYTL
jgi:hypothetical protein